MMKWNWKSSVMVAVLVFAGSYTCGHVYSKLEKEVVFQKEVNQVTRYIVVGMQGIQYEQETVSQAFIADFMRTGQKNNVAYEISQTHRDNFFFAKSELELLQMKNPEREEVKRLENMMGQYAVCADIFIRNFSDLSYSENIRDCQYEFTKKINFAKDEN